MSFLIENRKLRNDKFKFFINLIVKIVGNLINYIFKIFKLSKDIITDLLSGTRETFKTLIKSFNIGNGVIIKTIILIIIILILFFTISAIVYKTKGENPNEKINNLVSTDKNYSSFLINTSSPSFFGNLSNSFYNIIPDNYRFQFNFFKNKFNSIIGNDIYEITGTPREIIDTGRNDGIYNIKNNDRDNTYTTLKPKDIKIDISSLSSNLSNDYNKLSSYLQINLFKKNNIIVIPVISENNIWKYDIDNIYYEETPDIKLKANLNYLLPFIKGNKVNEFKLNKIEAEIFNDDDNSSKGLEKKMFNFQYGIYIYPNDK